MELVQELTQQLGINQQQASGGVGLIMGMAKDKLGGDFGQVAQHVPGVESMINSAPKTEAGAATSPVTSALGAAGGFLGGKSGGALGQAGKLGGGFKQLGLEPGMISRFVPIVMNFFQSKGGPAKGLLERALAYASPQSLTPQ